MAPLPYSYTPAPSEIDLRSLWLVVWRRRLLITVTTLFCASVAIGISFLFRPVYLADVLLAPVSESSGLSGSAVSTMGQFGGLASLAGLSVGTADTREKLAIATLGSRALASQFVQDHELLPVFFDSKWDAEARRWKNEDPISVPTLWDGARYFDRRVRSIIIDKKTGMVTLTVSWSDPKVATDWANDLVSRTNSILKKQASDQSSRNLEFLAAQLGRTTIVEVRQAIYRLMEQEIKTLALTEGATEYAFRIVDPPMIPHLRSSPNRLLFLLGGLIAGLAAGVLWAFFTASASGDGARQESGVSQRS